MVNKFIFIAVLAVALTAAPAVFAQSANGNGGANGGGGATISGSGSGAGGGGGTPPPQAGGGSANAGGGGGGNGGGDEPVAGNNLSFPAVAADGFSITPVPAATLTVPYDGPYTGLTAEELAALAGQTWYAQKTEGNVWQASYRTNTAGAPVPVFGVDWGDNVEAVDPLVGQPFRLEVTLYEKPDTPMAAYTTRVLANPSSPNEVQGTNGTTYESTLATIVSPKPTLIIQYLGEATTSDLTWNGTEWTKEGAALPVTNISFAPELNVAGKYVYGASEGGWRPVQTGVYRLTFRLSGSAISLQNALVGNVADWTATATTTTETETGAAKPMIDAEHNISYVDITVVGNHSSRKPDQTGETGTGGEENTTTTAPTLTTNATVPSATATETSVCTDYLTSSMGKGRANDSSQVILLQKFLNETVGTTLPLTGYFGSATESAVSKFQTEHADTVLQPWIDAGYDVSRTRGTGYVGVTTLAAINSSKCQ